MGTIFESDDLNNSEVTDVAGTDEMIDSNDGHGYSDAFMHAKNQCTWLASVVMCKMTKEMRHKIHGIVVQQESFWFKMPLPVSMFGQRSAFKVPPPLFLKTVAEPERKLTGLKGSIPHFPVPMRMQASCERRNSRDLDSFLIRSSRGKLDEYKDDMLYKTVLKRNARRIREDLELSSILDQLLEIELITDAEVLAIQEPRSSIPYKLILLLDKVGSRGGKVFEKFKALHAYLADCLELQEAAEWKVLFYEEEMFGDVRFYKRVWNRSERHVVQCLDISDSLIDKLFKKELNTFEEAYHILRQRRNSHDKVRSLLDKVGSRGGIGFEKFKDSLKESFEAYIAYYLERQEVAEWNVLFYGAEMFEVIVLHRCVGFGERFWNKRTEPDRIRIDSKLMFCRAHDIGIMTAMEQQTAFGEFINYRMSKQTAVKVLRLMEENQQLCGSGLKGIYNSSSKSKGGIIVENMGGSSPWFESRSNNSKALFEKDKMSEKTAVKGGSGLKGIYNSSSKSKGGIIVENMGGSSPWFESRSNNSEGEGGKDEDDSGGSTKSVESPNDTNYNYNSKEFRELEEMVKCKVCLYADLCIVFLPCRHMATCKRCASVLQSCPVCRASVKTTIRVTFK